MTKYIIKITGIRHYDFKDRLEELYQSALGKRMSIGIEKDNPAEKDAIIVYWGNNLVGHVRSGKDRELALSILRSSGKISMLGKIVDVDRENRWLSLELNCLNVPEKIENETLSVLDGWTFDGKTLPIDEPEVRLHTMLSNLQEALEELVADGGDKSLNDEDLVPWDEDMELWTQYIERNLWRDISRETTQQMEHIFALLTQGVKKWAEYVKVSNRLKFAIDVQGSPEVKQIQAKQVLEKAHSKEMDSLLLHYGERAKECVEKLPESLRYLFQNNGEQCMSRLWYLHRPYKQVKAIKTLLAMMIRLKDDEEASKSSAEHAIPESWLLAWGTQQGDKDKAQLIKDIVLSYETERTNAELCRKTQRMIDACNAPMRQTEAINALAKKPTIQAEHYHASGSEYNDNSKTLNLTQDGKIDANRQIPDLKKDK